MVYDRKFVIRYFENRAPSVKVDFNCPTISKFL